VIPDVEDSAFYWDDLSDPTAGGWDHLGELASAPELVDSPFFSPATLSWFGIDRMELHARVGLLERQVSAPESMRWRVSFFTTRGERITSVGVPTYPQAMRVVAQYLEHGFIEKEGV